MQTQNPWHRPERKQTDLSLGRVPSERLTVGRSSQQSTPARAFKTKERPRNIGAFRSAGMLEAVAQLDAQLTAADKADLARWLQEQYTIEIGGWPIGLMDECLLGPPKIDHRLSLEGSIIEHFDSGQVVPAPFDRARSLIRMGKYAYIEIWSNGDVVPIGHDGNPILGVG